jgi:hypothetical protein
MVIVQVRRGGDDQVNRIRSEVLSVLEKRSADNLDVGTGVGWESILEPRYVLHHLYEFGLDCLSNRKILNLLLARAHPAA